MYLTKQLAARFGLHPNTIRLYERLGYISPAQRRENNYRCFGELHVLQVKVCRSIFGYPFFNRHIRDCGNQVMFASAGRDYAAGREAVKQYLDSIKAELTVAHETETILANWISDSGISGFCNGKLLSRKEAAVWLGTTSETVRNWERNALVAATVKEDGRHLFDRPALDRMRVIYMLRLAGYSMAAVHRSLAAFDRNHADPVRLLHQVDAEDVIMVGDRWIFELERLSAAADRLPLLFEEMENLEGEVLNIPDRLKK